MEVTGSLLLTWMSLGSPIVCLYLSLLLYERVNDDDEGHGERERERERERRKEKAENIES